MKKQNLVEVFFKFIGNIFIICFILALLTVNQDAKATHTTATNGELEIILSISSTVTN